MFQIRMNQRRFGLTIIYILCREFGSNLVYMTQIVHFNFHCGCYLTGFVYFILRIQTLQKVDSKYIVHYIINSEWCQVKSWSNQYFYLYLQRMKWNRPARTVCFSCADQKMSACLPQATLSPGGHKHSSKWMLILLRVCRMWIFETANTFSISTS